MSVLLCALLKIKNRMGGVMSQFLSIHIHIYPSQGILINNTYIIIIIFIQVRYFNQQCLQEIRRTQVMTRIQKKDDEHDPNATEKKIKIIHLFFLLMNHGHLISSMK